MSWNSITFCSYPSNPKKRYRKSRSCSTGLSKPYETTLIYALLVPTGADRSHDFHRLALMIYHSSFIELEFYMYVSLTGMWHISDRNHVILSQYDHQLCYLCSMDHQWAVIIYILRIRGVSGWPLLCQDSHYFVNKKLLFLFLRCWEINDALHICAYLFVSCAVRKYFMYFKLKTFYWWVMHFE